MDKELTNYNNENLEAIDKFLSDNDRGLDYLHRTYTLVQTNSQSSVEITPESRKKCAKSLIR